MAEREAVAGKMKLIMSYQDDAGTWKERQVNLANLKANMEPTFLLLPQLLAHCRKTP